ncbi:hypothetical protein ABFX02_03G026000 [Erythranthe guttata]
MSNNQVQRGWEEGVICPEKGSSVVHYILRDSTANSLLDVVRIERRLNHMFYTVTEDYLRVFGSTAAVNARTAWKARKYFVEVLISITSGGGSLFANSICARSAADRGNIATSETSHGHHRWCSRAYRGSLSRQQHAWLLFRCKVLNSSPRRLKVQYCDINDCDGSAKLEVYTYINTRAHTHTHTHTRIYIDIDIYIYC